MIDHFLVLKFVINGIGLFVFGIVVYFWIWLIRDQNKCTGAREQEAGVGLAFIAFPFTLILVFIAYKGMTFPNW